MLRQQQPRLHKSGLSRTADLTTTELSGNSEQKDQKSNLILSC
jgi:hypothetical protein